MNKSNNKHYIKRIKNITLTDNIIKFDLEETKNIDKDEALETALQMIINLQVSKTLFIDLRKTRDYIYSIETVLPLSIILKLYEIIANIEIHYLNNL